MPVPVFPVIMGGMLVFMAAVLTIMLVVVNVDIVPVNVLMGMLMDMFVGTLAGMFVHVHRIPAPVIVLMPVSMLVRMQRLVLVSSLHALLRSSHSSVTASTGRWPRMLRCCDGEPAGST